MPYLRVIRTVECARRGKATKALSVSPAHLLLKVQVGLGNWQGQAKQEINRMGRGWEKLNPLIFAVLPGLNNDLGLLSRYWWFSPLFWQISHYPIVFLFVQLLKIKGVGGSHYFCHHFQHTSNLQLPPMWTSWKPFYKSSPLFWDCPNVRGEGEV